jgi:hypothetical protein
VLALCAGEGVTQAERVTKALFEGSITQLQSVDELAQGTHMMWIQIIVPKLRWVVVHGTLKVK